MKVRYGLVSNSSASSFCIYGWTKAELENTQYKQSNSSPYYPEFALLKKAFAEFEQSKFRRELISFVSRDDQILVGIGQYATEVDHTLPSNIYWEEFSFPEPSITEGKEIDAIAKRLGLPEPKIYKDTWFNG